MAGIADESVVLKLSLEDQTDSGLKQYLRNTGKAKDATLRYIQALKQEAKVLSMGSEAFQREAAARRGATNAQIKAIEKLQASINARKAEIEIAKQQAELQARYTAEQQRKAAAEEKVTHQLMLQRIAMEEGADAVELYKLQMAGATQEQIEFAMRLQKQRAEMEAKAQADREALAAQKLLADEQARAEAESRKQAAASQKLTQQIQAQKIALTRGADAAEIYKLKMSGATNEQIKAAKEVQRLRTELERKEDAERQAAAAVEMERKAEERRKQTIDRLKTTVADQARAARHGNDILIRRQALREGLTRAEYRAMRQQQLATQQQRAHNQALIFGNKQYRQMRGMMGQMGHQIQDVAVQMQMGTDNMIIMAQQGSQVASLFGPTGALVGAAIAAAGAFSMMFTPSVEDASDELDDLTNRANDAISKMRNLTGAALAYQQSQLTRELREQKKEQAALTKQYNEAKDALDGHNRSQQIMKDIRAGKYTGDVAAAMARQAAALELTDEAYQDNKATLDEYNFLLETTKNTAKDLADVQAQLAKGINARFDDPEDKNKPKSKTGKTEEEKRAEAAKGLIAKLREQNLLFGRSAEVIRQYEINTSNLTTTERALAQAEHDKLKAKEEADRIRQNEIAGLQMTARANEIYEAVLRGALNAELESIARKHDAIEAAKLKADQEKTAADQERQRLSNIEQIVEKSREQAMATNKTAREIALYELALNQAGFEEVMAVNRHYDAIEAAEARKEAMKKLREEERKQEQAMAEQERRMNSLADSMANAIMNANNLKDAFRSMAQSIIQDMLRMYLRQQMLGVIGMVVGNISTANTYGTNIGSEQTMMLQRQDAGLTPFPRSYEGGGFTGFGARSGGLDGRGGFGALLHPNETVIDHTKGQSGGENIVVNLNISTGVAQTVRAEISNLMPAISEATKSAVLNARMRGGSFSKGLVGA